MTPQELKNSILQLAIQGKLVPQRAEEGTAEELYNQIQAEKQKLIKAGKIKKEKPLSEITDDEKPFEIPYSWKWVRISDIAYLNSGNQYEENSNGFFYLKVADMNIIDNKIEIVTSSRKANIPETELIPINSIIFPKRGGAISTNKKRLVLKFPIGIDSNTMAMSIIEPKIMPYIIKWFLNIDLGKLASGTSVPQINNKDIYPLIVPLPPLAEQKRIIAKIEKLLPYVERYEKAYNELQQLNKRFPGDLQKSVLQLAIQGRLVPQRAEEGNAEDLYQKIQAEKEKLVKERKIKKEKPLPPITDDEKPFEIPESWKWVRLNELCKSISDGDHQPPPQVSNGYPFLVISNISSGKIDFSNTRYVSESYFNSLPNERVAKKGDILFTVTGSLGIPIKVEDDKEFCFQRHIALLKVLIKIDCLNYFLRTPMVQLQCNKVATGTAQKTIGLKSLRNLLIPLPPLAEQKRIVAKIEELLPLCDKLK